MFLANLNIQDIPVKNSDNLKNLSCTFLGMYQLLESWNSKPIGLLPKPENNGKQWITIEKNLCAKTLRAAPPTPPTFLSFCNCCVNMRSRPDKNHING